MKRALAFTLMVLAIMIIAVSCEEPQAQVHEHTYATEWTSDAEYHWHKATCEHTDEVSDKEEHVWGDWITDKEATETEKGSKHRVCSVCERTETSDIAEKSHAHTYSTYQWSGSRHWRVCTSCGEELSSSTHSKTWNYNSDTHYQSCYCGWSTNITSHSMVKSGDGTKQTCECGYSNTLTVQVERKAELEESQVKSILAENASEEDEKKTVEIIDSEGEKSSIEAKNVVANNDFVTIDAGTSVAAATSSTDSSSSGTGSSGSGSTSPDVNKTEVVFPAGALKMNKNEKKEISLTIKLVTPTEATSSGTDGYQVETVTDSDKNNKVSKDEAVVAGIEFELKGAAISDLRGDATESGTSNKVGTEVTTFIAAGLGSKDNLTIKYIGDNTEAVADRPVITSYDNGTGELKFTLYHFSKYAIVASNVVATDVKGNMYASLEEAVKSPNIGESGKITLLKNVALDSTVNVEKSLILDLNGKTITTKATALDVQKGTLTVRNGKIESAGDGECECVISVSCTSGSAGLILENSATIDSTESDCLGILSEGTASYTAKLNISGKVLSKSTAVYQKSYGSLTINEGSEIKSSAASAVEIGGGNAVINGGTLVTETAYGESTEKGTRVVGAAVAVSQYLEGESLSVQISRGTFTAEQGKQLAIVNPYGYDMYSTKSVKVTIASGVSMQTDKIVGTKTGDSIDVDGVYYLNSASALQDGVRAGASVTKDKITTNYLTLEEALANAADSSEIKLIQNATLSSNITLDKSVTIDLDDKVLDMKSYSIDLSEDKNIKVIIKNGDIECSEREWDNCGGFEVKYGNTLVLNDVVITDTNPDSYCFNSLIEVEVSADAGEEAKSPSLEIRGATITSEARYGILNVDGDTGTYSNKDNIAKIKISGSTLTSSGVRTVIITGSAEGTIEGSTITGKGGGVVVNLSGGPHTITDSEIIFDNNLREDGKVLEVSGNNGDRKESVATVTLKDATLTVKGSDNNKTFSVDGTSGTATPKLTGTLKSSIGNYYVAEAEVYLTQGDTTYVAGAESLKEAINENAKYELLSNIITMGTYPGDEEAEKIYKSYAGKRVEWRILKIADDGKVLVISEKVLPLAPDVTHTTDENTYSWEKSGIRTYLNSDEDGGFIKTYGLSDVNISEVTNSTEKYGNYEESTNTTDKIFLLSFSEVATTDDTTTTGTNYSSVRGTGLYFEEKKDQLAYDMNGDLAQWWLRSPCPLTGDGYDKSVDFCLITDLNEKSYNIPTFGWGNTNEQYGKTNGIRPAFWF